MVAGSGSGDHRRKGLVSGISIRVRHPGVAAAIAGHDGDTSGIDPSVNSRYPQSDMNVSLAEAQSQLPELIRAVEDGETVVITRQGKPVAQITSPPPEPRQVQFDSMRDRIELLPGWDDPVDLDRFLAGDL